METYTKLFSSIIHSTIWREPHHRRIVWVTMLAMKDRHGHVWSSLPGLADAAKVTLDECVDALDALQSPDPYSRTKDHEGRRIAEIDGGWLVLNHKKFRDVVDREVVREQTRIRVRNLRKRRKEEGGNVTNGVTHVTQVTPSNDIRSDQIRSDQIRSDKDICSEPEDKTGSAPNDDEIVVGIPHVNPTGEHPITKSLVAQWQDSFPSVDVIQELRSAREWCLANPSRRKTKRGVVAFLVRWLSKSQDRGGRPLARDSDWDPQGIKRATRATEEHNARLREQRTRVVYDLGKQPVCALPAGETERWDAFGLVRSPKAPSPGGDR